MPTSRRVSGAHGLSLHLFEWSQEGVPLLMLHGFGNEANIWAGFAACVAPYYRTLALDQRGHGDSEWDSEGRYDHEYLVEDVEQVAAELGIERLVLIGHSLGGRIATLYAGRHPQRMAGLVLVDIGPELDPRGPLRMRQDVEQRQDPRFESVEEYARIVSLNYPASSPEATLRMARDELLRGEDGLYRLKMDPAFRGAVGSALSDAEMAQREQEMIRAQWDALAKIQCPTLVVRGAASDFLSPEVADRMVEEVLPNGRLVVVAQAGHSVMSDNPEGFNEAVSDFVLSG